MTVTATHPELPSLAAFLLFAGVPVGAYLLIQAWVWLERR